MNLVDLTINDLITQKRLQIPNHIFAKDYSTNTSITYKELDQRTDFIAKGMIAMGLKKKDKIGIMGGNSLHWIEILLAAVKVGIVPVPINVNYYEDEVRKTLILADIKIIFIDSEYRDKSIWKLVHNIRMDDRKELCLEAVIIMDEFSVQEKIALSKEKLIDGGRNVSDSELERRKREVTSDDIYTIQFTSGTTADPKGVMLRQYAVINSCRYSVHAMELKEHDSMCIPVPLFTTFGTVVAVLTTLIAGATLVNMDYYSPKKMLSAMEKYKCTVMMGVPTMYINMMQQQNFKSYDLSALKKALTAGAMCPEELMNQITDAFELEYMTGMYGMTEMSCGCTITKAGNDRKKQLTTVGQVFDNMELKIVDKNNQEVAPGIEGEIVTKGYHLMKGYYKNEEETKKVIDQDGWLHSGDIGMVDEDGYYKIVGRMKHIIIRGGFNISPEEIEETIRECGSIIDVQVVGIEDEIYGEEIVAFVQVKDDFDSHEIQEKLKNKIAKYKIPKYFFRVNEFEYSPGGKVQKYKLKELAQRKIESFKKREQNEMC